MQLEVTYEGDGWIVWRDGARIAGHVRQADALRHAQNLLAGRSRGEALRRRGSLAPEPGQPMAVAKPESARVAFRKRGSLKPRQTIAGSTLRPGGLRVLAAEDNRVNCLVLAALLNQVGVEPTFVTNGAEAIAAWESDDWDLILMDIRMPQVDGISATRAVRAAELATGRPSTLIVAVTANTTPGEVGAYKAAGMDGVVGKPINAVELFGVIERVRLGAASPSRRHSRNSPQRQGCR